MPDFFASTIPQYFFDLATKRPSTALALAVGIYFFIRLMSMGRREKNLPPGPPTLPVIGNLHQIPKTGLHTKLLHWANEFGGVFSLKIGSGTMIVLVDRKAVHELVDKKGNIYSERPHDHVTDIVTHGDNIVFMSYTTKYRAQHKIASQHLSPRVLDKHVGPIQDAEVSVLLRDLLDQPAGFYNHVKRMTCSVACAIMFGQRGATFDSFFGHCVYDAMDLYSETLEPGANPPVDQFPILQYLPDCMSPWRVRARHSFKATSSTWAAARAVVDEHRAAGDRRQCLANTVLDDPKICSTMSDTELNHFLGVLVEGASDTTASNLLTMIACLARHPEHQRTAQAEIDAVCGDQRMPVWSDFAALPFVNCIVKEVQRWHGAVPLGVPHRVSKDDWYDGMFIPKDATIVVPSHAIHRSERYYKNPEVFDPARFLGHPDLANNYAGSPDYDNRDHYGYGAGRRICVGIHLAERTQFRVVAKILWAFDIVLPVDPVTGVHIVPDPEAYYEGIMPGPKPFQVEFRPRSPTHAAVIRREMESSLEDLRQYD